MVQARTSTSGNGAEDALAFVMLLIERRGNKGAQQNAKHEHDHLKQTEIGRAIQTFQV